MMLTSKDAPVMHAYWRGDPVGFKAVPQTCERKNRAVLWAFWRDFVRPALEVARRRSRQTSSPSRFFCSGKVGRTWTSGAWRHATRERIAQSPSRRRRRCYRCNSTFSGNFCRVYQTSVTLSRMSMRAARADRSGVQQTANPHMPDIGHSNRNIP